MSRDMCAELHTGLKISCSFGVGRKMHSMINRPIDRSYDSARISILHEMLGLVLGFEV